MSKFDKDKLDDFLINRILDTDANGDEFSPRRKQKTHEHPVRPPHALTPEEVSGQPSSDENEPSLNFSLPSANAKKPEFVVFETNIKPEIIPDFDGKKIDFSNDSEQDDSSGQEETTLKGFGGSFEKNAPAAPAAPPVSLDVPAVSVQADEPLSLAGGERFSAPSVHETTRPASMQKPEPAVKQSAGTDPAAARDAALEKRALQPEAHAASNSNAAGSSVRRAPALTLGSESFFERMKKVQQKQSAAQDTEAKADMPAEQADGSAISPNHTAEPSDSGNQASDELPKPSKIMDSVKQFLTEEPKIAAPVRMRTKPASEMTVEELIRYAEEKAEKRVETTYRPQSQPVSFKPATYFESKITPNEPNAGTGQDTTAYKQPDVQPEPPVHSETANRRQLDFDRESNADARTNISVRPQARKEQTVHTNIVKEPEIPEFDRLQTRAVPETAEVTSRAAEALNASLIDAPVHSVNARASDELKAAATPSAVLPQKPAAKVTPVKKSRIFTTPSSGDIATAATKVVAKEVHVDVDLVDSSLGRPAEDDRIKSHNPYASQYSLADAELAGKVRPAISAEELAGDEDRDIISSSASAQPGFAVPPAVPLSPLSADNADDLGRTIALNDFDMENILSAAAGGADADPKKIRLFGNREPENAPEDIPVERPKRASSEMVLSDYETPADKETVESDLSSKLLGIVGRFIPTLLITIVLFLMTSSTLGSLITTNASTLYMISVGLLVVAAVINFRTMKGLWTLITFRPDFDSPAALAVLAALAQGIVGMIMGGSFENILTALGGLALTSNLIGKFLMLRSIAGNFSRIASERPKKSAYLLEDPDVTSPLAAGSVLGEALIFSGRRIVQAKHFLRDSYRRDPYEKTVSKILFLGFLAAAAVGVVGGIVNSVSFGVTAFAAIICLCCPPSSFLMANLPLRLANKRLNRLGAQAASFEDARNFSYANAITIDAEDLFPKGRVKLFNMHILAAHPIDQSILEAAAITDAVGSPLAQIFDGMLSEDMVLPEVDAITYENKMGLSGWVGEKRIFIGNRTLMETHDIVLPSIDVDKRILQSGYFPVYLASTEGPAALFIVGYEADEEISYQLRRLSATGVTILVHSCDQNINEEMICDYFDLYADSVKAISPQMSGLYKSVTKPAESGDSAGIAAGDAAGFAALLTACIRMKENYTASLVLHIIGLCLGVAFVVLTAMLGASISFASAIGLGMFQIVWTLITMSVSIFRRP